MSNGKTLKLPLNIAKGHHYQQSIQLIYDARLTGLSVGAAWIAGQDRSMWRTLRPSAGQAQQ